MQINNNPGYTFGTWTPRISFGGSSVGIVHTLQAGTWIRIGNIMFATFAVKLADKGAAVGDVAIEDLPMPSLGLAQSQYAVAFTYREIVGAVLAGQFTMYNEMGLSKIYMAQTNLATGARTTIGNGQWTNTSQIYGTIVYPVG